MSELNPPQISCTLKCIGNQVDVAIMIERPINGFYGCRLAYELGWTPDLKSKTDAAKLEKDVRERVAWKVGMETGLLDTWAPNDIRLTREG